MAAEEEQARIAAEQESARAAAEAALAAARLDRDGAAVRAAVAAPLPSAPAPLPSLNIDPETVVMTGLGDSADFAHQFHIAFAALVRGACVFSGQPFT